MMELEEKDRVFKSFEDLKAAIESYEKEKKVTFYIKSSNSAERNNIKINKEKKKVPIALVYVNILFHCSKYGEPRKETAAPTTHSFERRYKLEMLEI